MAAVQVAPSMWKESLLNGPEPETDSGTFTPAGVASGMATGAPVYENVVKVVPGRPVGTWTRKIDGLVPRPMKLTSSVKLTLAPHGAPAASVKVNGSAVAEAPGGRS